MFYVLFMDYVSKPKGSTPAMVLEGYNKTMGSVDASLLTKFQQRAKRISECKDYFEFLDYVRHPSAGKVDLFEMLSEAQHESVQKGYERRAVMRRMQFRGICPC